MLEKVKDAPKGVVTYYGEVKSELSKVTWPTKREVYGTTIVVVATVFFFGVYLALVDLVLHYGVNYIFGLFK